MTRTARSDTMEPVRLAVVDDHPVFCEAFTARLDVEADMTVVGTAGSGTEAQSLIERTRPDMALVDVELGSSPNGIELAYWINDHHPKTRVLMVTCLTDSRRVVEALRAGAVAWVTKDGPTEELLRVIRGALRGESWIPPRLLRNVLRDLLESPAPDDGHDELLKTLTKREQEIIDLMIEGLDRSQIAQRLYLSKNTVRTHTQNVLMKLRVHSSLEAVSLGLRVRSRTSARQFGPPSGRS